jgi:hypothetical protein
MTEAQPGGGQWFPSGVARAPPATVVEAGEEASPKIVVCVWGGGGRVGG